MKLQMQREKTYRSYRSAHEEQHEQRYEPQQLACEGRNAAIVIAAVDNVDSAGSVREGECRKSHTTRRNAVTR